MGYDYEDEPDYTITLTCTDCDKKCPVSGNKAEYYGLDDDNFICLSCQQAILSGL